jgi:hypothetical protein
MKIFFWSLSSEIAYEWTKRRCGKAGGKEHSLVFPRKAFSFLSDPPAPHKNLKNRFP